MQDRVTVIEQAAAALENGQADTLDGQDPQFMADMLRTAHQRGGLGAFAAFKTAQRILAETFQSVGFSDIQARDRIRFATDSGERGRYWRTGTVVKVTGDLVMVICDNRTRAVIHRKDWQDRSLQRSVSAGQP